ncbi:hypothetical protein LMC02_09900 [Limosilactobacillus reuteri]|uniref:hypothetical protein n=1 Tax=Limosilactobacillus reuteri TaxID=1598 RepID=UPI001E61861B|nr:hypothetical protein [Limosilactobacillus reuteri]MCC4500300.1 hypothetical protein [Limosilactobacillus reuteri]MCC4500625.1 hypothetical protein [Limosilactobacillus reuteri]
MKIPPFLIFGCYLALLVWAGIAYNNPAAYPALLDFSLKLSFFVPMLLFLATSYNKHIVQSHLIAITKAAIVGVVNIFLYVLGTIAILLNLKKYFKNTVPDPHFKLSELHLSLGDVVNTEALANSLQNTFPHSIGQIHEQLVALVGFSAPIFSLGLLILPFLVFKREQTSEAAFYVYEFSLFVLVSMSLYNAF